MITSWNWVLLADFASFKPVFVPDDNPADYNYFFDTSRRRVCYIAPERFKNSSTLEIAFHEVDPTQAGTLTPEMDIFSAGCSLMELWNEGVPPFEYSDLLQYRSGKIEIANEHLQKIENDELRRLISSMISIDPAERKSAEIYLDRLRGSLLPEYFYQFLQSYIQMFSSVPIMPVDDKVNRLHADTDQIIEILCPKNDDGTENNDGLVLITAMVTSCIRGILRCNSKINSLEILQKLAQRASAEVILDRILPYILHLTNDTLPRVRVCALDTLTACMGMVKHLPHSDMNIFPEYILPSIAPMSEDKAVLVRIAYARNIGTLADTALKFLEQVQKDYPDEMPTQRYDMELNALHEILQQAIMSLLTDSQSIVKQTLIESGITTLCTFFGRQKANDVILSHMITFLNDKEDKNLRGSFFDCIVGVAQYVGWHCSPILAPLLEQGLTDPEEFVIAKAIRATTLLTELDLIQKSGLTDYIKTCACYLNHPNLWIRHEVCGLISTAATKLTPLDVQCKIMPAIVNHLKVQVIQVEKTELLLDSLQKPLPRTIYDTVLRFSEIEQFFNVLKERKQLKERESDGTLPQTVEMSTAIKTLFRRLQSDGLNELSESQLLSMSRHLIKLQRYKLAERPRQGDGVVEINDPSICREVSLNERKNTVEPIKRHRKTGSDLSNVDWQHMYPTLESPSPTPSIPSNDSGPVHLQPGTNSQIQPTPTMSIVEYSMPDRSFIQEQVAECKQTLDEHITQLKAQYIVNSRDYTELLSQTQIPANWQMKGQLIAHLHEHKGAVTRMTPLTPFGRLFTSVSDDGTVRLWDCHRLDGNELINKSRQMYQANSSLCAVATCENGKSLVVGGKDGALLLLKIDPNSSKMALQQARGSDQQNDNKDDGPVVDMMPLDQGSQNVIVYCTVYGAIIGWDIRMPGNAWRFENDLRKGVSTTMCIDPTNSWLAVGTSCGWHICWDLRFQLPIHGKNGIRHPHNARIRKIACHPTEPSWLLSASQRNNEIFSYNIETQQRQTAFWASPAAALSEANSSSHAACALLPGVVDTKPFLLTGGTDQRIRYWDFMNPDNCSVIVGSPLDAVNKTMISYGSRLIEGTQVIQEVENKPSVTRKADEAPRSAPEMPHPGHYDAITELLMCKTEKQLFVASSSRDGVIKLWK